MYAYIYTYTAYRKSSRAQPWSFRHRRLGSLELLVLHIYIYLYISISIYLYLYLYINIQIYLFMYIYISRTVSAPARSHCPSGIGASAVLSFLPACWTFSGRSTGTSCANTGWTGLKLRLNRVRVRVIRNFCLHIDIYRYIDTYGEIFHGDVLPE